MRSGAARGFLAVLCTAAFLAAACGDDDPAGGDGLGEAGDTGVGGHSAGGAPESPSGGRDTGGNGGKPSEGGSGALSAGGPSAGSDAAGSAGTPANEAGGSGGAAGSLDVEEAGAGASTGGASAGGSAGAEDAGGIAGAGGFGGAPPGCQGSDSDAPALGPGRCHTDGQCTSAARCEGSATAKLCVPIGEGCDLHEQCPTGTFCQNQRCAPAAAEGSDCSAGARCASGLYCGQEVVSNPSAPESGEYTMLVGEVQCRSQLGSGMPCDERHHEHCQGPSAVTRCAPRIVGGPTCRGPAPTNYLYPTGSPHNTCPALACETGAYCDGENEQEDVPRICRPYLGEGATCYVPPVDSFEVTCADSLYCDVDEESDDGEGVCRRLPSACEPCAPQAGVRWGRSTCNDHSYCAGGVCVARSRAGESCERSPCGTNLVCVTARENGTCTGP